MIWSYKAQSLFFLKQPDNGSLLRLNCKHRVGPLLEMLGGREALAKFPRQIRKQ